jgi:hypothetical protein
MLGVCRKSVNEAKREMIVMQLSLKTKRNIVLSVLAASIALSSGREVDEL